jgi:MULE transposase domain
MYETDATFGTNSLKLPLSIMVGIDNCGKTFPVAYCYITSESAASFKFVARQLTDLVFYDCPEAEVIIGDFAKGLGAAVAAKAAVDIRLTSNTEEPLPSVADQDRANYQQLVMLLSAKMSPGENDGYAYNFANGMPLLPLKRG